MNSVSVTWPGSAEVVTINRGRAEMVRKWVSL
jgi:hypothetical protein